MGLVDYEKLKIELEELTQAIRARDKELPVLRSEAGRASQVSCPLGVEKHRSCCQPCCCGLRGSSAVLTFQLYKGPSPDRSLMRLQAIYDTAAASALAHMRASRS